MTAEIEKYGDTTTSGPMASGRSTHSVQQKKPSISATCVPRFMSLFGPPRRRRFIHNGQPHRWTLWLPPKGTAVPQSRKLVAAIYTHLGFTAGKLSGTGGALK
ncbi:hypothetical protein [Opitutus sp. ER46]|uniref:hypothetical protein n=1 Tax=Opitutus sp. ER46 TaxID=2161864 RepID=UPI0011B24887|nr:hypothetical protein [Opitutus sp. ER46]